MSQLMGRGVGVDLVGTKDQIFRQISFEGSPKAQSACRGTKLRQKKSANVCKNLVHCVVFILAI